MNQSGKEQLLALCRAVVAVPRPLWQDNAVMRGDGSDVVAKAMSRAVRRALVEARVRVPGGTPDPLT